VGNCKSRQHKNLYELITRTAIEKVRGAAEEGDTPALENNEILEGGTLHLGRTRGEHRGVGNEMKTTPSDKTARKNIER